MANYEVIMRNGDAINVEGVNNVTVNNETYFLTNIGEDINTVVFSAPAVNVYQIIQVK
ncbi:hypothetical protein [Lysinibacillus sphaericus]|uniref:hypothetical protein n=1 Tax=Lysinibacillus sphaericus TaxID=1421 RepID=UPI003CFC4D6D